MTTEHRYIVIEGPIGAGKTSLARLLAAHFNARLILENVEDNPFLRDFYRGGMRNAFTTQLFFLLNRFQQQQDIAEPDMFQRNLVSDYLFEKDSIFAEVTLNENEKNLYFKVADLLKRSIRKPDLVVFLYAPEDALMQRIRTRARGYEDSLQADYLRRVSRAYLQYFHNYSSSPLLMVNTEGIDPVNNLDQRRMLFETILKTRRGRNYFNPPSGELL